MLATIGYEKSSLADFVATLRLAGVDTLVDVRERAQSRRPGFSKSALALALQDVEIKYLHLPELGDPKEGREAARAGKMDLFREIYGDVIVGQPAKEALDLLVKLISQESVCLMCFERDHNDCHRKIVAQELEARLGIKAAHWGSVKGWQMAAELDECFILIKAQPHRSSRYFETVCCAGVGRDQRWRRQYPVPFRILAGDQQFKRWEWIRYSFVKSKSDPRPESQRVMPETLEVIGEIKSTERAGFLQPLIRASFAEANSMRESLTLIRPRQFRLEALVKSQGDLQSEAQKHKELASQLSLLDSTAKPLAPCPMRFIAHWQDQDGKRRRHECDDWETSAAFNRFERDYGRVRALEILKEKYEDQYMKAGLALGFSTHKRRNAEFGDNNQWLLVGMIRLNEVKQTSLPF